MKDEREGNDAADWALAALLISLIAGAIYLAAKMIRSASSEFSTRTIIDAGIFAGAVFLFSSLGITFLTKVEHADLAFVMLGLPLGSLCAAVAFVLCGLWIEAEVRSTKPEEAADTEPQHDFAGVRYQDEAFAFKPSEPAPEEAPTATRRHSKPAEAQARPETHAMSALLMMFDPTSMSDAKEAADEIPGQTPAEKIAAAEHFADDPALNTRWRVFMGWVICYLRGEEPPREIEHEKFRPLRAT